MQDERMDADRLDSWKEIAAYFNRDIRTVRRWEKERKLPIHRFPGGLRGRVYARTAEIETWLRNKSASPAKENGLSPPSQPREFPAVDEVAKFAAQALKRGSAPHAEPPRGQFRSSDVKAPRGSKWSSLAFRSLGLALVLVSIPAANQLLNSEWIRPRQFHTETSSASGRLLVPALAASLHHPEPETVELYLKGRYFWNRRSADDLRRALGFFSQAIAKDPSYAPGYAGLADCYALLREYSTMPESEAYARAIAAADRAIELDDTLPEGHRALAFSEFFGRWNAVLAEREFKRAIELNPNDAEAHHWYASMLSTMQRYDEALSEIDRARQLQPTSIAILADRDVFLLAAGRRKDAIVSLVQLEHAEPSFISTHRYLGDAYLLEGRYKDFLRERREEARLSGNVDMMSTINAAGKAFDAGGSAAMLNLLCGAYKRQSNYASGSNYEQARYLVLQGKKDEAVATLRTALQNHDPGLLGSIGDPLFEPLHADPRFVSIIRESRILGLQQ